MNALFRALLLLPCVAALFGPAALAVELSIPVLVARDDSREFTLEEYMLHREVVIAILKSCPPSECVYVGLGRSPTVYMAMLENLAPGSVRNLPLSLTQVARDAEGNVQFSAKTRAKLDDHLTVFLPSPAKLGGKRIMLVDYVHSGRGLLQSRKLVKEHYKKFKANVDIDVFAFGSEHAVDYVLNKVEDDGGRAKGFVDHGAGWTGRAGQWANESWDKSAQFDSYEPGGFIDSNMLEPRPEYKALTGATKRYLELDPDPTLAKYRKPGSRGPAVSGGGGCQFKDINLKYGDAIRNLLL